MRWTATREWILMTVLGASAILAVACGGGPSGRPPVTPAPTSTAAAIGASPTAPQATSTATSPSPTPSSPSGSVPSLLASAPGFVVVPIDAARLDQLQAAVASSISGIGTIRDLVGATARREGSPDVEVFAFTILPAQGRAENDGVFAIMESIAAGTGGSWEADEARGWFLLDHTDGRALVGPFGTVPGATVFLLATGVPGAPVEDLASALFGL